MSATETRPDLLAALPGLVAGHIRTVLPGLRDCRGMAGRLDVAALKARGIAAPAVLVTRLGCTGDTTYAGPHPTYRLRMAAFILCRDELGLDRDTAAATIAQVLLGLLPGQDWGLPDDLMGAERVTEEPLVSAASDKLALALTAVTWEQVVALAPFPAADSITPEFYLGQRPQVGAAHEADYQRIGGDT